MLQFLSDFWPHLVTATVLALEVLAAGHAVLYKRDSRATIGWVGLILLTPGIGAVFYWLFGINRIHRRAALMREGEYDSQPPETAHVAHADLVERMLGPDGRHLLLLEELVGTTTEKPLLVGNHIEPLLGGDEAYPAMLEAIAGAQRTVAMYSYIFDNDRVGRMFVEALTEAHARGVEIRILIDAIGSRYTFPSIVKPLRAAGISARLFMRSLVPGYFAYFNLRTHRKIMVVDGRVGFTGGMNVREGCLLSLKPTHPTQDVHFRVAGPVVVQLMEVIAEDWAFTTKEILGGELWYPPPEPAGHMLARGIRYGPDEDHGKMRLMLIGAIGVAQKRINIVTPYFLPDDAIICALNVAAMRGVEVNIVLPERGNLTTVRWAMQAMLWQVLERGCKVWRTPEPFDHSKLMTVDGVWSLVGSGNWDPRSLRLNFEFNVEIYDRDLTSRLDEQIDTKRRMSREFTLEEADARRLPLRLRDGFARLMTPYL